MSEPTQQIQSTLQARGYSFTKPRQTLFAALQGHESQTMHQLVTDCPAVDRATVYRNVKLFEELGIIQRLRTGWKYRLELTDKFVHHHHHLTCTSCGVVTALAEDTILETRLQSLARANNFQADDHQLEIRGICQSCQHHMRTTV